MNIVKPNPQSENSEHKYDVTLSFAEEDRMFVEEVAAELLKSGLRFYYDEYERIDMWGKNLYTHLDEIYRQKARYCVVFISKNYKRKLWTQHERESAQARAFKENREYILPFRFDNTEIAGMPETINYLTRKEYDSVRLAEAIVQKVSGLYLPSKHKEKPRLLSRVAILIITLVAGISAYLMLSGHFTSVNTLTLHLYKKSKRRTLYSRCKDNFVSPSTGSGTCSHHGGIDTTIDTVVHDKTMLQCRQEAIDISWLR